MEQVTVFELNDLRKTTYQPSILRRIDTFVANHTKSPPNAPKTA